MGVSVRAILPGMEAERVEHAVARARVWLYLRRVREEQQDVDPGPLRVFTASTLDPADSLDASARDLVPHAGELLAICERVPDFSCCKLQWGIDLDIGGRDWTDGTADHFWHVAGWIHALRGVLTGGPDAVGSGIVWDQSSFTMQREGDDVLMFDPGGEGTPAFRPLCAPLLMMARTIADAGQDIVNLATSLRGAIAARGHDFARLRARLAGLGDAGLEAPARLGDTEMVAAILAHELDLTYVTADLAAVQTALGR